MTTKDDIMKVNEDKMINIRTVYCLKKEENRENMKSELDKVDLKYDGLKSDIRSKFKKKMNIESAKCKEVCNTKSDLPFINAKSKCKKQCEDAGVLSSFSF